MESKLKENIKNALSEVGPSVEAIIKGWAIGFCGGIIHYSQFRLLIVSHNSNTGKIVNSSFLEDSRIWDHFNYTLTELVTNYSIILTKLFWVLV